MMMMKGGFIFWDKTEMRGILSILKLMSQL